jgi:NAD(P)H-nitrite reductase large subunit
MAVSGCHLSCFESWGRDIGLIGLKYGWQLVIAWNVAAAPRIAQEVASGLEDADILDVVDKIVQCYQEKVQKGERLGKTIERIGLDPLIAVLRQMEPKGTILMSYQRQIHSSPVFDKRLAATYFSVVNNINILLSYMGGNYEQ